jgi:hypothetical protein
MASPFFFLDKKDGKLQPCQDYRYLNEHTVKNAYPLPLISELLDKSKAHDISRNWMFDGGTMMFKFETEINGKQLFEPTVMFFGMCNSPATDGRHIWWHDWWRHYHRIHVYMDDIFLFAPDKHTLTENTKRVLACLQENDLSLKPKKCKFNKTKVEYLGMVIEEGKISMDPEKLRGIRDWPVLTTVKQVRGFSGFGNFYRWSIQHFSELAKPLNKFFKKDQKFEWTNECQQAFDQLKKRLTEEPVLMIPDQTRPFQIETDASKYATGAVLTQIDANGNQHPISFISKTLSPAEQNYEIYDRELLAIIWALEEWRHYIQGSLHTTIILSDHKNLTYHREAKNLNRRQACWSLYLSKFDVKLVHTPGHKMIQSDALSRRPDLCPDNDTDNEDIIMLPENIFISLIDLELQMRITISEDLDDKAAKALKLHLENAPTAMTTGLDDWKVEESEGRKILFYKGKNYIPQNMELRQDIVKLFHDHKTAGHPGELGTYNAIRQHYWWPGMHTLWRTM